MNFPEINKPDQEIPVTPNQGSSLTTRPNCSGILGFLQGVIFLELLTGFFLLLWSIFTMHGSFALAVLLFSGAHAIKGYLIEHRNAMARWLALLVYFGMWWCNPELLRSPDNTEHYPVLQSVISWWCIIFGALYLFCFNFTKQLHEAPEAKHVEWD
jgi:hypothetical protein